MEKPRLWFLAGCLLESALLILAILLGWWFGQPALKTLHWNREGVVWGLLAVIPMGLAFGWMLRSPWPPLAGIRQFLDQLVRPVMGQWSLWQLGVISLIAGLSEEALFRGLIQGGLASLTGQVWALLLASALFGLCHSVTWAYAVIAAVIGAFLGAVWIFTGNLLAPMVAHAVYDFLALVYFLRRTAPSGGLP